MSELPSGTAKPIEVDRGNWVGILNDNGQIYAFNDVCPHAHCSLAEGFVEKETIICICHGHEFNFKTGEPVNPPFGNPVHMLPAKVEGDDILVEF